MVQDYNPQHPKDAMWWQEYLARQGFPRLNDPSEDAFFKLLMAFPEKPPPPLGPNAEAAPRSPFQGLGDALQFLPKMGTPEYDAPVDFTTKMTLDYLDALGLKPGFPFSVKALTGLVSHGALGAHWGAPSGEPREYANVAYDPAAGEYSPTLEDYMITISHELMHGAEYTLPKETRSDLLNFAQEVARKTGSSDLLRNLATDSGHALTTLMELYLEHDINPEKVFKGSTVHDIRGFLKTLDIDWVELQRLLAAAMNQGS